MIDDDMILDDVTLYEALVHFTCIGWKVVFAIIPPPKMCGGWACFVVALVMIGVVTIIVAEAATVLGCVAGMPGSVTAITLVAMGTSLPDTFASMTAARTSEHADSAIGNVTGSNCVNVFLGLGLPWVIAAHYNARNFDPPKPFEMPAGDVGFSVMMFLLTSVTCFIILIWRRIVCEGELGGQPFSKWASAVVLFFLWVLYVVFSSLKSTGMLGAGTKDGK